MIDTSIKVDGLRELDAKLSELGGAAVARIVRRGLRAAGAVIRQEVMLRAPERPDLPSGDALPPGALKRDIRLRFVTSDRDNMPAALVQVGRETARAAYWVEYGHRLIRRGKGEIRLHVAGGDAGYAIGDVPEHPFMRPAFEAAVEPAIEQFKKTVTEAIDKEASKK